METAAADAGLDYEKCGNGGLLPCLSRIVVEELEAWFFGDIEALATAYPGVSPNLGAKALIGIPTLSVRDMGSIGKSFAACGILGGGLSKIEVARKMAQHMNAIRILPRVSNALLKDWQFSKRPR